ncbi:hypothetical protein BJX96DRAFT_144160, partial [Aspergillus floccosus]
MLGERGEAVRRRSGCGCCCSFPVIVVATFTTGFAAFLPTSLPTIHLPTSSHSFWSPLLNPAALKPSRDSTLHPTRIVAFSSHTTHTSTQPLTLVIIQPRTPHKSYCIRLSYMSISPL